MKISVITVCFNSEDSIRQAIDSVVGQSHKDIEYIIIDGGSTDSTPSIVSNYSHYISKFVSEPDNGIYHAMNKGVRLSTGDYIYFLNSDDYLVDRDAIADVVSVLERTPRIDFLYGNINFRHHLFRESREEDIDSSRQIAFQSQASLLDFFITACLPHPASFARSTLFEKAGYYNEQYKIVSDYKFLIELVSSGDVQFAHYDRIIASHYCGGVSSDLEQRLAERFHVLDRAPIYQTDFWLKRRVEKYQSILTNPQGHWGLIRPLPGESYDDMHRELSSVKHELSDAKYELAESLLHAFQVAGRD